MFARAPSMRKKNHLAFQLDGSQLDLRIEKKREEAEEEEDGSWDLFRVESHGVKRRFACDPKACNNSSSGDLSSK